MARPPVRRQNQLPGNTSRTSTSQATPSPTPSTSTTSTTSNDKPSTGTINTVTSQLGPAFSTTSSSSSTKSTSSTSSLSSSSTSTSSSTTPAFPTDTTSTPAVGPGDFTTITSTSSAVPSPSSGTSETNTRGKTFLENKPLSGFVFGLAGLAALIVVFIVVTSFVRRRNRKRLLADASNFSFDPKDVEDGTSDEKHSRSNLIGQHDATYGLGEYSSDGMGSVGFAGVGTGSISRPGPSHSPPMPTYPPQDYVGYDGGHPAQYHNMGNVPIGYSPPSNPYDMYGPRNGGGYPNGQGRHDSWNFSVQNGHSYPMTESGPPVPRQLQPGIRPPQGPILAPRPPNSMSPPLNRTPQIPSPTSPPPAFLQPSTPDQKDLPRLPTPRALPDTFGRRESSGSDDDDAYGGAFLGPESPEQRTLQVANM